MEERFKIVVTCTSEAIAGCENMSIEEVNEWMQLNQEVLPEPSECGDLNKYIVLDVNHEG